jgi:transposase
VKLRKEFLERQRAMDTRRLVFVDETAVHCFMNRLYGWSARGRQSVIKRDKHGSRLSVVGAITQDGLRGHMTYTGTLNGDRMLEFVMASLGPNLRSGDVVVMDGLSAHKMASIRDAVAAFGATILILPPYSLELNPIELAWSTLKARVRAIEAPSLDRLSELVDTVWAELAEFCAGWVRHCGYATST